MLPLWIEASASELALPRFRCKAADGQHCLQICHLDNAEPSAGLLQTTSNPVTCLKSLLCHDSLSKMVASCAIVRRLIRRSQSAGPARAPPAHHHPDHRRQTGPRPPRRAALPLCVALHHRAGGKSDITAHCAAWSRPTAPSAGQTVAGCLLRKFKGAQGLELAA